ncbi:LysE family translocator [Chengkuizengella axinellae]|uniref:LysE family translocator n=1 Tax=Chengkuizengella axinellae TaxID=3064388 RepID=A0ABT9IUD8_9BACL|nr:LysE family translocator [Chengkuizengella sp. 2205SS18-9]MDP5272922.1 LysE family translocator [Chengkuizengella sp. 2205SS18-9]
MEMNTLFFVKGIILGFSIAAPVGPIGLLCIQRTLMNGRKSGFFTGLGVATADMIYGFVAGFGLAFISNFLLNQKYILQTVGGVFLVYLGIRIFLTKPHKGVSSSNFREHSSVFSDYISAFFLTLSNPVTILSFLAIFSGLGIGSMENPNYFVSVSLVVGVFLGSAGWWFILTTLASLLINRMNNAHLQWVNRMSGIFIFSFGVFIIYSLITSLIQIVLLE